MCIMDFCDRKRLLMIMTSACASAAFGLLCIAVATDYWLFTMEKLDEDINGTAYFNMYWTGLFRKCKVDCKFLFLSFSSTTVNSRYLEQRYLKSILG